MRARAAGTGSARASPRAGRASSAAAGRPPRRRRRRGPSLTAAALAAVEADVRAVDHVLASRRALATSKRAELGALAREPRRPGILPRRRRGRRRSRPCRGRCGPGRARAVGAHRARARASAARSSASLRPRAATAPAAARAAVARRRRSLRQPPPRAARGLSSCGESGGSSSHITSGGCRGSSRRGVGGLHREEGMNSAAVGGRQLRSVAHPPRAAAALLF